MADLSHWDFAIDFSGGEMAALILGIDPVSDDFSAQRISPVWERISHAHELTRWWWYDEIYPPEDYVAGPRSETLTSIQMFRHIGNQLPDNSYNFFVWLQDDSSAGIEKQRFSRAEIVRWLDFHGFRSVYQFSGGHTGENGKFTVPDDIDPADLPDELHAANTAFRAVRNGYGDKLATFKNRLIDFLETNNINLKPEAVQRIATVANPDKSTGRKKRDKE